MQSLIQMTQGMYEQDVVNKENELRSVWFLSLLARTCLMRVQRDNIIAALQTKIHSLESTLAKCLKKDSGQAKTMVDLNLWMSSPLTSQVCLCVFSYSVFLVLKLCQPITPSKVARPSKEEDDIEEDDDDDDDKPLCDDPIVPATTLGKRERPVSPTNVRPVRRTVSGLFFGLRYWVVHGGVCRKRLRRRRVCLCRQR